MPVRRMLSVLNLAAMCRPHLAMVFFASASLDLALLAHNGLQLAADKRSPAFMLRLCGLMQQRSSGVRRFDVDRHERLVAWCYAESSLTNCHLETGVEHL